jgi:hypothetical protein
MNVTMTFGSKWAAQTERAKPRSVQRVVGRDGRFFTCFKHGWDAMGKPCPKCTGGDAPKDCIIHGWSHLTKGCPECAAGR